MESESTGTAVTVTLAVADAGVARSPVSLRTAVVVCGPVAAVEEMSTPTVIVDKDESAVAVQLRSRVEPEREHAHPASDGADAKISPVGTVATSFGKWYAVPEIAGERVNV